MQLFATQIKQVAVGLLSMPLLRDNEHSADSPIIVVSISVVSANNLSKTVVVGLQRREQ